MKNDFYKALAQNQHEFFSNTMPRRGEIFIKDLYSEKLYPLAVNKELSTLYAIPKVIEDKKNVSDRLSTILELDADEVYKKIDKKDDPYEVIKKKISDELVEMIKKEEIEGIDFIPEITRYYPGNELASNVIGFLGYGEEKPKGQYGIEGFYNEKLEGKMGFMEMEKDASGKLISFGLKSSQYPKDGTSIVLTIDQTIQYVAEKKIKNAVELFGAVKGDIIIMNPKTGEIIAMAQYQNYNPNEYFTEKDMSVFLNSGIHNLYEPGSIQKPLTMAIGIDTGKIGPSTTYIDEGFVKIDNWTIRNSDGKVNGKQSMKEVLEKSLNTGTIFVAQQVEKSDYYKYLSNFGLDQLTGIEISGEARGNLSNLKGKKDINYATASYGQGISVTPLAIINAISALANDGKLMKPHIVSEFINPDGTREKVEPTELRQVVSPRTANIVSAMMISVIENGHAKLAKVAGYNFAGKTGTAQIPKKDGRGYEEEKTIHTFVGFGPMPSPKFSILVKLDEPKNAPFAADTTAIVFRELTEELVNYYNIPPTRDKD
ncbi:penicillin-binding protein 2 [Patescibacteria group bacterium]|nr:penicillin-binding protein 2 [Patescibacteria group bacterium]